MEDWMKDKAYYKILNMENPGNPIEIGFNCAPIYQFVHGAVVEMPVGVANALNEAVVTKYKISGKENEERTRISEEVQRYMAIPMGKESPEVKKMEEKKNDFKKSLLDAKKSKVKDDVE